MSLPSAAGCTQKGAVRRLLACFSVLCVAFYLSIQLYGPFLRTLVICDAVDQDNIYEFSGSPTCDDKEHVLGVAQAEEGRLVGMKLLVHGFAGPILAILADSFGRFPVLVLGMSGFALAFSLFTVVSVWPSLHQTTPIVWLCFFVEGATGAFDVTFLSMLADMTAHGEERARVFSAYFAVSAVGEATAQLLAVLILKQHLRDYTLVWLGLATLLICDIFLVTLTIGETMPRKQTTASPVWQRALKALGGPCALASEPFMRRWLLALWLSALATGVTAIEASFTIAAYGWEPGDWQSLAWPSHVFQLCSLSVIGPWTHGFDERRVVASVTVAGCVTQLLRVMAPFSHWALVGPNLLASFLAFGKPLTVSFLSSQFAVEQQAKVHALTHLCTNLGSSLSIATFSSPLLFRPDEHGWAAAWPFVLAAAFACIGGMVRLKLIGVFGLSRRKVDIDQV